MFELPPAARLSDRLYDFRAVAQHVLHPCELERLARHIFFVSPQRLTFLRGGQPVQLLPLGTAQVAL